MGNYFEWRPFAAESNEPFRLEYYDDSDYAKSTPTQLAYVDPRHCRCIWRHFKKRGKILDVSPAPYTIPRGTIFINAGRSFIRISNPGNFICYKCVKPTDAKLLYDRGEDRFIIHSEEQIKWSIIPCIPVSRDWPYKLCPMSFKIINVPNFGYILFPGNGPRIFHLPEHTIIPPKSLDGNVSSKYRYVVNTVEVGAVGLFNVGCSYEYIAKDENGNEIKLNIIKLIENYTYDVGYGTITLKQGSAEYKSFTNGCKTKVAPGCSLG